MSSTAPISPDDILNSNTLKSRRKSTRRSVANSMSDVEFTEPKKSRRAKGPKVNYVKSVKKKKKTTQKKFTWSWNKISWMFSGILVLRLIFMEGGVVDYNSMENTLLKREHELKLVRQENADLVREIHRLRTSPQYQKKVAREHLGVIAKDEYLVLFSRETSQSI